MSEVSINNFCNVSVAVPGKGLGTYNVNTLLYITDDESITKKPYYLFYNADSVAKNFGSDSRTFKVLSAVFAQSPSLLAPGGYVIVLQRNSITLDNATAGYTETLQLDTLDDLIAIASGSLNLTVDGETKTVSNIDLSTATNFEGIAKILTTAGESEGFKCEGNDKTQTLKFISLTTGTSSSVVLTGGSIASLLNINSCIVVAGQEEGTEKETLMDAIIRANNFPFTEGIIADQLNINNQQDWINASNYIQGTRRMLFYVENMYSNTQLATSTSRKILSLNNFQTRCLYYNGTVINALLFAGAYAGRGLATDMSGSRTTITMNLKDLSGVAADTSIDDTIFNELKTLGYDFYCSVQGGLSKVVSSGANQYFDDVFNMNWFVLSQLVAGFNTIATTTTKIPQTEAGMNQIKSALEVVCQQALRNGFIAAGKWTSTDYFGDYETFMRNIEENGYYIYSQPIDEQSASDRQARKAPLIQIAIKYAGAIHSINILINYNA